MWGKMGVVWVGQTYGEHSSVDSGFVEWVGQTYREHCSVESGFVEWIGQTYEEHCSVESLLEMGTILRSHSENVSGTLDSFHTQSWYRLTKYNKEFTLEKSGVSSVLIFK
jgi:hypothetical protein